MKEKQSKELARDFPEAPGVYIMKDSSDRVIYVGKAKVLKNRVSSYFTGKKDVKTEFLVKNVASLEYIVTDTEFEALLLENNLIKKWSPRYNIDLKDGKTYPVVRVTQEEYPRVYKTRRVVQDGSRYFGPYPDVRMIETYLGLIDDLFPLRKCRGRLKKRDHPCLYYHLGKCRAPCCGKVSRGEYLEDVSRAEALLEGKTESLRGQLKERMEEASRETAYERAAFYRDTLRVLEDLEAEQRIVDFDQEARDYVSFSADGPSCVFVVFQMREGRISGRETFFTLSAEEDSESLDTFLVQYYGQKERHPREIYIDQTAEEPEEGRAAMLSELLARNGGASPSVRIPQRGRHRKMIKMAQANAWEELNRKLKDRGKAEGLKRLKELLGLPRMPRRIEGFDIAQLSGLYPVASLVSFWKGLPDKEQYRRFHMKTLGGKIDDYKAISEAVARRYTRLINEEQELPDLILVDGGKGQVSAAAEVLRALGLENRVSLAGLAKRQELIYLPGRDEPVDLPEGDAALQILQHVRDETHRFATAFNQQQRRKRLDLNRVKAAPGIGDKRSRKLLAEFGSLDKMAAAEPQALAEAAGISLEAAETVRAYLADTPDRGASDR